LNYNAKGSVCYDDKPENCEKYGRLYDWNAAMKACPNGWHLPSNEEWDNLYRFADGSGGTSSPYESETAGKFLKAKSGWNNSNGTGTDAFEFSALPGGFRNAGGYFFGVGEYGNWWSASTNHRRYAYAWSMGDHYDRATYGYEDKADGYSVRCVKDN
jgi:uncharacterized protein (TIGR02145 family)